MFYMLDLRIRVRFEPLLRGHTVDPSLHSLVSAMMGSPFLPQKAISARLKRDETWEARYTVAVCSGSIFLSINNEKLDLITVLSLHLFDNLVPLRLKLDTPNTVGHEKVDDDKRVVSKRVYLFLEVIHIERHDAVGFLPPILLHFLSILICFARNYKVKKM